MKTALAVAVAAMLIVGCATAPPATNYRSAGSYPYRAEPVNRFPTPDRPAPDNPTFGRSPPVFDPPYRPMSVTGPPPATTMAGEVIKGVARTLMIVGLSALSGQSFSIGGGRIYGNVYAY